MFRPKVRALAHLFLLSCVNVLTVIFVSAPVLADDTSGPVFDLTSFPFESEGKAYLRGDWWFKFGARVDPAAAARAAEDSEWQQMRVPMDWRLDLPENEKNPHAHGYATYVIKVTLPRFGQERFGIAMPRIADAYRIYWVPSNRPDNFKLIGGDGTMDGPMVASHGQRGYSLEHFDQGYLVVHVRKELQGYGGIIRTPFVATSDHYQSTTHREHLIDGTLIGMTAIVMVLNFFLYLVYRKDAATLILAIASFAFLLRSFILAGGVEMQFGPEARDLRIRLEYTGILVIAWTSLTLHQTLLWNRLFDLRLPLVMGCAGLLGAAFLFTAPLPVVTDNLIYVQVFCLVSFVLILFSSVQALLAKRPDAWTYTLAWFVPMIAGLNDIYVSQTYSGVYLVNYAYILFISFFSLKVGRRVTRAINRTELLEQERHTLKQLHDDAVYSARHDHLTGLLNRQAFDDELALAWQEKDISGQGVALVIFDIDHFKLVNDTHGHPAGDKVLKEIAALVRTAKLRSTDRICRYGGEEFVIILPDTSSENGVAVAERVRGLIQEATTNCGDGLALRVTASFGIAHAPPEAEFDPIDLLQRADQALYCAKGSGRNRTLAYDDLDAEDVSVSDTPLAKAS